MLKNYHGRLNFVFHFNFIRKIPQTQPLLSSVLFKHHRKLRIISKKRFLQHYHKKFKSYSIINPKSGAYLVETLKILNIISLSYWIIQYNLDFPYSLGPNETVRISYNPTNQGRFIHIGIGKGFVPIFG